MMITYGDRQTNEMIPAEGEAVDLACCSIERRALLAAIAQRVIEKRELPEKVSSAIVAIEDCSDPGTSRARVVFKNGYTLSVIQGPRTYGGPQGLFEIGPMDRDGKLNGSLLGIMCDNVEGFLEWPDVIDRMVRLSRL